jgi:hypothetical protein
VTRPPCKNLTLLALSPEGCNQGAGLPPQPLALSGKLDTAATKGQEGGPSALVAEPPFRDTLPRPALNGVCGRALPVWTTT